MNFPGGGFFIIIYQNGIGPFTPPVEDALLDNFSDILLDNDGIILTE